MPGEKEEEEIDREGEREQEERGDRGDCDERHTHIGERKKGIGKGRGRGGEIDKVRTTGGAKVPPISTISAIVEWGDEGKGGMEAGKIEAESASSVPVLDEETLSCIFD